MLKSSKNQKSKIQKLLYYITKFSLSHVSETKSKLFLDNPSGNEHMYCTCSFHFQVELSIENLDKIEHENVMFVLNSKLFWKVFGNKVKQQQCKLNKKLT